MATIGEDMKAGEIEKIKAEVRAEERAYLLALLRELQLDRSCTELLQAGGPSKYVN